ncbi:pyroglutamylated RFamide peptide receptor-like [Orbicella faveolata]|nr:pyroglutamylated RFamide peptide receptor-like [Orbicella faveolata]
MYPLGNKGNLTKRKLKVIIPGSWILSLVFTLPLFLITIYDKNIESCVENFRRKWMAKAYSLTWLLATTALPLVLMVGLYSTVVYALWCKNDEDDEITHQQKGVMKVRKRVTLMVITVSSIFGISWGTSSITYVLKHFTTRNTGHVAISTTMALLNSAVNPFLYALFNQPFRGKVKRMLCSTFRSANRIQVARETESIEVPNRINHTAMQPNEA